MRGLRALAFDGRESLRNSAWKLLLPFLLPLAACYRCKQELHQLVSTTGLDIHLSLGDYVVYLFAGRRYLVSGMEGMHPALWALLVFYLLFVVADYPVRCLRGYGLQSLLRYKKREHWWFEKCVWLLGMTAAYFILLYAGCVLFCWLEKVPLSFELSERFLRYGHGIGEESIVFFQENRIWLLLLIFFACYVIALLLQTLALWLRPRAALLFVAAYVYVGAYLGTPVFVGNFTVLLYYADEGAQMGIRPEIGLWILSGVVLACLLMGCLRLGTMDFIDKERV